MPQPDFVIAGAGIIGLALALELDRRGASVVVLEAHNAMQQTSHAAAGMLAVDDLANPPALHALAAFSASLYPAWLDRIADLSGTLIPFQTTSTLDSHPGKYPLSNAHALVPELAHDSPAYTLLDERSIDPRQLAPAILAAVRNTRIDLREQTALERIAISPREDSGPSACGQSLPGQASKGNTVRIQTSGQPLETPFLIDTMGTWSPSPVSPRKGQMLAVQLPPGLDLATVIRTPQVYIVPRTQGPNAGRAIIGATLEDKGFDLSVHPRDILTLNARAVELLPKLAQATFLESWAGLRPGTADGLPFLGPVRNQPRYILATGHFRNGILLAPATAHLIAQHLFDEPTTLDLTPFSAARLSPR